MKGRSKKILNSILIILLIIIPTMIFILLNKTVNKRNIQLSSEQVKAMSYIKLTDEDSKVENTEFVKFSAFFTRDLDGDGNAEKLLGTCRNVNYTDMLYMDLNVLTQGYLKDGKITINGTNFNYSMNMVKDLVLKNNYISNNVKEIELNQVNAGTQKLILGNIISKIGNNTNNYSNISSITLTGIHVSEDGTKKPISKTVNLTVDWYGDVTANIYTFGNVYYNYDNLTTDTLAFKFRLNESNQELLLKENVATITIPQLNGYWPTQVICLNDNVQTEYNEETRTFIINRSSKINDNGIITSSISNSNTYEINVTYPKEAYEQISSYTKLEFPIEGYYVGYNNSNSEFENPNKSNIAKDKVTVIFRETPPTSDTGVTGYTYNFDVQIADKKYVSKPNGRYVVSKQDLLTLYENEEYKGNFKYTVKWYAFRGTLGEVSSIVMNETKESEQDIYGDKFDENVIQEYTTNTGIYFEGQDKMLGENGTISVYNNDTNELIKSFTKEDWNIYNANNPYKYEESVKHIRVETSTAATDSTLIVSHIKDLDANKIIQEYTKEEVENIERIYTYLTGTANIVGQNSAVVNDLDYAYYVSEKSYAKIGIEKNKLSTQETCYNQKIYVTAECLQVGDSKWKNGEFLIEIPKEIINMEINNVTIDNENVKIVAYDLLKKDGKYFIKIITENNDPLTYKITIDCNVTPDPTVATTNKEFKLYAYNEYCNNYYYETQDIYDVNRDNDFEELVATSSTSLNLLSPTSLITLETVSNYNDKNEITIAPNVAQVEREKDEQKQATINVSLTNNYPNTISGILVLGKIPFEGNTYNLNGKDLKSTFNTTMTNEGIILPEDLKDKVIVYYSEKENPTKDILDAENGWKLKENVEDFSKIKTYLVDMKDVEIKLGEAYTFNYIVNVPENVDYNLTSFSTHVVYYELNTEGGKLQISTEPNKVGIRIVKKFNLELIKYKMNSNVTIPGVSYILKFEEENLEGEVERKKHILTTNNEGKILLEDLFAEKEYSLQEFRVPDTCELNEEEIKFTVNADGTVNVNGNVKNHNFANGEILQIDLEDEVKYNLEINKTKIGGDFAIDGVRFKLEDEKANKEYIRTKEGKAVFVGLSINKIYILTETAVPATCEINKGVFKFKLVRENGLLKVETIENSLLLEEPVIKDLENELTPILDVNVQNEIKYSLELTKQDKETNKLRDIQFTIKGEGFSNEGSKFTTSKEGKISIYGLLIGKTYILEEIKAEDYYLDSSKDNIIEFKIDRTKEGLEVTTWNKGNGIVEVGTKRIFEKDLTATLNVVLENEKIPTYNLKLIKVNEDGEKLKGAQFKLTSQDTNKEQIVTTDENGEVIFENLYEYIEGRNVTGEYVLEEIFPPEGYILNKEKLKFKAIRDENEKIQIQILEGDKLVKENSETNEKEITSNEDTISLNILNKPIFTLKKYGDNNILLPNTKFQITDLDGNIVTDVNGEIVGTNEKYMAVADIEFIKSGSNLWTQNEDGTWVSGNKGIKSSTSVLTTNDFIIDKTSKISFEWSVSSESVYCDYLYYTITNINTNTTIGGTSNKIGGTSYGTTYDNLKFMQVKEELEPGTYKITFTYRKDSSVDVGTDSGYIRNLLIEKERYIVTTNEKGEVSAELPEGMYKAVELGTPEGYSLPQNEEDRTYYFGISQSKPEEEKFQLAWAKSVKSELASELEDIVSTEDGGTIAVGKTFRNIDINGDGVVDSAGEGNRDGIIIKYDKYGSIEWSKILGGIDNEELFSIEKNPYGGYLIAGITDSREVYLDDILVDTEYFGKTDGILMKIDDSGNYIWSQSIGGDNDDIINSITVSETGDIAVTGNYVSAEINLNKDRTDSLIKLSTLIDNKNAFIGVYSNNGEYKWSQNIGGEKDATGISIISTNSGFVVAVNFNGTAYLNADKTVSLTSKGNVDGVIIAYNGNGNISWNKQVGSKETDKLKQITIDKDGNIIVVGAIGGSLDLNEDGNNDLVAATHHYSGMIVKLNKNRRIFIW